MKVTPEVKEKSFEPVSISITFESEVELNEFYCVFNFTQITGAIEHVCPSAVRRGLEDANGGDLEYQLMFSAFEKRFNEINAQ